METISNDILTVSISCHGAELQSIIRNSDNREYLWHGDPAYWKRRSPILFPIVGSLWNGCCSIKGNQYTMSQHGFARDMDFELITNNGTKAVFRLSSNETSLKLFPYEFSLEISYQLIGSSIKVMWQVCNISSTEEIYFQIGAHPAFNFMDYNPNAEIQGYFAFDIHGDLCLSMIGEKGCLKNEHKKLQTTEGVLPIVKSTFNEDALILEKSQVRNVTLCNRQKEPYLKVSFDAPVVGLWSPARDSFAPFVCIEPWYGRCDREHYTGTFEEKDWMQQLMPHSQFNTSYIIDIL